MFLKKLMMITNLDDKLISSSKNPLEMIKSKKEMDKCDTEL